MILSQACRPAAPAKPDGLPAIPPVPAHAIANWLVAIVLPSVQRMNWECPTFRTSVNDIDLCQRRAIS
jgi:hypothetical protein